MSACQNSKSPVNQIVDLNRSSNKRQFYSLLNFRNLKLFVDSFMKRTDISPLLEDQLKYEKAPHILFILIFSFHFYQGLCLKEKLWSCGHPVARLDLNEKTKKDTAVTLTVCNCLYSLQLSSHSATVLTACNSLDTV